MYAASCYLIYSLQLAQAIDKYSQNILYITNNLGDRFKSKLRLDSLQVNICSKLDMYICKFSYHLLSSYLTKSENTYKKVTLKDLLSKAAFKAKGSKLYIQ